MSHVYRPDQVQDFTLSGRGTAAFPGGIDLATAAPQSVFSGAALNGAQNIRPPGGLWHTGGQAAQIAADGVDSTPVITEIYVAAVFVPFTVLATGIAQFNGSVASGNFKVALFDALGNLLRASATTAMSGTDAYQSAAFATGPTGAAATTIVLPSGTYYTGIIYDNTTARFNAHGVGAFPGGKITGAVYATAFASTSLTITPPTAFTAASLPPIQSIY